MEQPVVVDRGDGAGEIVGQGETSRGDSRDRRKRSARVPPSRYSITSAGDPRQLSRPKISARWGCAKPAIARASRRSRTDSAIETRGSVLMATRRSSAVSNAR